MRKTKKDYYGNLNEKNGVDNNPSRPNHGRREKIKLNSYFHTSLWCLKRFYEGLKGLIKLFEAPQRNLTFNLIFVSIQLSVMDRTGRDERVWKTSFEEISK